MIQMQPWPLVGLVKITFGSINLKTYLVHLNYATLDGNHNVDGCHHSLPRDGRVKKRDKDKEGSVHVLQTNKILQLAEAECRDMHSKSNITRGLVWIDDGGGDDDIIDMDEEDDDGGENISLG